MTIVTFPEYVRVEVTAGTVQSATITDANGTRPHPAPLGERRFFVDVIEAGGGRVPMWDGTDHAEALRQATELAADFGCSVQNRTGRAL
jgi:hypothetical protein